MPLQKRKRGGKRLKKASDTVVIDRVCDKNGRVLFTEEMKESHKILVPMMLPIHFKLLQRILKDEGYNIEILDSLSPSVIDMGLRLTHNDTCYPAQCTIGLLMEAVLSGKYDTNNISLLLMQTGGGCRASNYVKLLRKALRSVNMDHIPVISFNLGGMERNPGFKITPFLLKEMAIAVLYGDILMHLYNQVEPYELEKGSADALVEKWAERLVMFFGIGKALSDKEILYYARLILEDFAKIPRSGERKVRVGVVGEIYVKFAPLGNNNLEFFLRSEDCEVVVPGLMDFMLYSLDAAVQDFQLYGNKFKSFLSSKFLFRKVSRLQNKIIDLYEPFLDFNPPARFLDTKKGVEGVIHTGTKMGEGWLLTAEMIELIESGVENIVCTQPFGCLPNHIVGRGMFRKIKELYPESNIVPIDYDASATKVNQENRIKLMLATAKRKISKEESANEIAPS